MKIADCKNGVRVALDSKTFPCYKGTIKTSEVEQSKSGGPTVIVEWDNLSLQKVAIKSLLTEAEGLAQDVRLQEEKARLEKEFELVSSAVADKMKEAATAIRDAHVLARNAGRYLSDMYEETSVLVNALDNAGWSTSSWSC